MAICCEKVGDIAYAKKVLEYGANVSQDQLGSESFYAMKFQRRLA
jgi:hypothetical protein